MVSRAGAEKSQKKRRKMLGESSPERLSPLFPSAGKCDIGVITVVHGMV